MDEFIHAGRFERRDVISRITGKHHDDLGHGRMKQRYEYGDKGGIVVIRGADDGDPGAGFAEGGGGIFRRLETGRGGDVKAADTEESTGEIRASLVFLERTHVAQENLGA